MERLRHIVGELSIGYVCVGGLQHQISHRMVLINVDNIEQCCVLLLVKLLLVIQARLQTA